MNTMKLGTETGSLFNHLMSNNEAAPVAGQGATVLHWSDRHAYFVDWVSEDGKECMIERVIAKRTDEGGMSDAQEWSYHRNPDPNRLRIMIRYRYGAWWTYSQDAEGKKHYINKLNIIFGVIREYYDFSF